MNRYLKTFICLLCFLVAGYFANLPHTKLKMKLTGNINSQDKTLGFNEVLQSLSKEKYDSLGFFNFRAILSYCSNISKNETWNVMQFIESKDDGIYLADLDTNNISKFRYFDEMSFEENFNLFTPRSWEVNDALQALKTKVALLKKNELIHATWRTLPVSKSKCLVVLTDIRKPTEDELNTQYNRGPKEISPSDFFEKIDYDLFTSTLANNSFNSTIPNFEKPMMECAHDNTHHIQWTIGKWASLRYEGISLLISDRVRYFTYLHDRSHPIFANEKLFVPFILSRDVFNFHYEEKLYVSWKDVNLNNFCGHVIHEIRKATDEENNVFVDFEINKESAR